MKNKIKISVLLISFTLSNLIVQQKTFAQVSVNFQLFYDKLSPYGYWVDNPEYGYVWVPEVGTGFTPYSTSGHWILTDFGWTWVSDYSWGWAPFHYGRWYTDPFYGPIWVPGYEWGPGWVAWRRCEGYYGWAPIEPGISISVAYSNGYRVPDNRWIFVKERDFGRSNISNYYVPRTNNTTIINKSTVINNTRVDKSRNVSFNAGPEKADVQTRTGRVITPVALKDASKPGQNLTSNELRIYRPKVESNNTAGKKPAPSKITNMKDVKPVTERNDNNQTKKVQPVQQQKAKPENQEPLKQQGNIHPNNNPPVQHKNVDQSKNQHTSSSSPNEHLTKPQHINSINNDQHKDQQSQKQQNDISKEQPKRQVNPAPAEHPPMNQKHNVTPPPPIERSIPQHSEQPVRQIPPDQPPVKEEERHPH